MVWLAVMSIVPNNYLYGITRLAVKRGGTTAIGKAVGLTKSRICQWTIIPDKHLCVVAELSGIPAWALRPDLAETFGVDLDKCGLGEWRREVAKFLRKTPTTHHETAVA